MCFCSGRQHATCCRATRRGRLEDYDSIKPTQEQVPHLEAWRSSITKYSHRLFEGAVAFSKSPGLVSLNG